MTESGITVFWHPVIRLLLAVWIIALQLLRLSYIGLSFATVMEVNPLHPVKAFPPIEVTEFGMVMEVSPLHPRKASSPMVVTVLGMFTEFKPLQLLKAREAIAVTEFGMIVF